MKREEWRDVKGYEGHYQVSSFGRVKSLKRTVPFRNGHRNIEESILKGSANSDGYLNFGLYLDGRKKTAKCARLVAVAFLNHTPCGHKLVIDHIDGDKLNNRVDNLEIVTNRENSSTCYRSDRDELSSKYVGVYWSERLQKWIAEIQVNREKNHLGCFSIELDAHNAYQEALLNLDNPEYFELIKPKYSSKYKNIFFDNETKKWVAKWNINGKQKHIGYYITEEDAYIEQQSYIKENNLS